MSKKFRERLAEWLHPQVFRERDEALVRVTSLESFLREVHPFLKGALPVHVARGGAVEQQELLTKHQTLLETK